MNVYLITNIINNKKYVGITNRDLNIRFKEHIKSSKMSKKYRFGLQNAILKYSEHNFEIKLLRKCSNRKVSGLFERAYIKKYDTYCNGYNETYGGDGSCSNKYSKSEIEGVLYLIIRGFSVKTISKITKFKNHTIHDFSRKRFNIININKRLLDQLNDFVNKSNKKHRLRNDVINIIEDYINGMVLDQLAVKYKANISSIRSIINRESYPDVYVNSIINNKLLNALSLRTKPSNRKKITV